MGSEVSKTGENRETAYEIDMSENGLLDEGMTSEVYRATRIYDKA
jgi:hypothetical protein